MKEVIVPFEWQQVRLLKLAEELTNLCIGDGFTNTGSAPTAAYSATQIRPASYDVPMLRLISQYRSDERGWEQIQFSTFHFRDEEFDAKVVSTENPWLYEDEFTEYVWGLAEGYRDHPDDVTVLAVAAISKFDKRLTLKSA